MPLPVDSLRLIPSGLILPALGVTATAMALGAAFLNAAFGYCLGPTTLYTTTQRGAAA
ncbi:MAG: DUF4395 family protein [Pseudonocardiaceae bacterium]